MSDKHTPSRKSAIERREERRATEGEADYKVLKELPQFNKLLQFNICQVPKTIFERNVSPGLERKD